MNKPVKIILHVDLDAFFASVEQRDQPALRGQPVVIGADPKSGAGRGVVATCSYEARKYGVRSAMPISQAYRLCPRACFIRPSMDKYRQVSQRIFALCEEFSPQVEPVSIDEAFLDISGTVHFFGGARAAGLALKKRIHAETGLSASVGIAPVKMAAKIASDLCKPDGLLLVSTDRLLDFLWPLGVERLWGVGPRTQNGLLMLGVKTIGELAQLPPTLLEKTCGRNGQRLYQLANGIDPREVIAGGPAQSVSQEHTFSRDTQDRELIEAIFLRISEQLSRQLRQADLRGSTLTLKLRLADFETFIRTLRFARQTNFSDEIFAGGRDLFERFYRPGMKVRLIGLKVSGFKEPYVKDSLFAPLNDGSMEKVHRAVDEIKDRFGERAIQRGGPDIIK